MTSRRVCPVAVVRLRLRFEESVGAVPAAILPPGWTDTATAAGPDHWRQLSAGPYAQIATVYPSDVTYTYMPPRQASQVDVRISWKTLPVDPRTLRGVGIEVFTDAVTPDARLRWQDQGIPPFDLTRDRLRFMGTADRFQKSIDKSYVRIPGRCFTGLLLDARLYPAAAASVNLLLPIDKVVAQLVGTHPATTGMEVVWLGAAAAPTLEEAGLATSRRIQVSRPDAAARDQAQGVAARGSASTIGAADLATMRVTQAAAPVAGSSPVGALTGLVAPPARKAAPRATRFRSVVDMVPYLPVKDDTSIWDAITDITVQAGIVAWVHLDKVYLAPARNVFAGARRRRFVQARNCNDLSFERDLGRRNIPAVEVRCWDSENRRRLVARYPTDTAIPTTKVSGKTRPINPFAAPARDRRQSDEDVVRVVQGITSQADLDACAEAIYLELRRNQLAGGLKTTRMVELGADGTLGPDPERLLLDLRSGDVIDVQPALAAWDAGDLSTLKPAQIQARLEATGVSSKVAVSLAAAASKGLLTTFWTKEAAHNFSSKNGYSLAVRFSELPTVGELNRGRDELVIERRGGAGGL